MNTDQWISTVFLTLLIYAWGILNRGWTSPADMLRSTLGEGHNSRSEDQTYDTDMSDDDTVSGVVSGVGSHDHDNIDDPNKRTISVSSMDGPRQIRELYEGHQIEQLRIDKLKDNSELPSSVRRERREWVALRLRPNDPLGLTVTQIDKRGAELFECDPKTIERDRAIITKRIKR